MNNRFLLLEECADVARVSVSTVRHWIKAGKLRTFKPGRRRLVLRADFEAFLEGRSTDAPPAPPSLVS